MESHKLDVAVQAILLDRDGVINQERADYVKCWDEFCFLPGVLRALARVAIVPVPILVISNQSAIGRSLVSWQTVNEIHRRAQAAIEVAGGRIDAFFICPHHPNDHCECRKPKPGLLGQAARAYGLDLGRCVFIGDAVTDFQAAQSAGCPSILVETGRQGPILHKKLEGIKEVTIVADLTAAVSLIVEGV
jgi:D-glycero-D-manno-heptose 1,7-bisphosphate phosphatase